jgi:hypothetical protein
VYLIQDKLTTSARQDHENSFSVKKLLKQLEAVHEEKKTNRDSIDLNDTVESERLELIQTGLTCL